MATYRAAVTFENGNTAPETVRTTLEAGSRQRAAALAVRAAKTRLKNRRPTSIVILLEPDRSDGEAA